ncbi:enolase-phosphatase E1-like isoform X1 [Montipora capricornis]|uniref:enolase-phosphatase E1-like isoform X1 n=1 Tax=Montipora foliosa TaxID=591990 RepID=UPI0035F1F200
MASLKRETDDLEVVLLDIEGTTTPITFVKDILFPHAKKNVRGFLERNWDTAQCKEDVLALKVQAEKDKDMDGVVSIPDFNESSQCLDLNGDKISKDSIINALVKNVIWQMNSDRKTTALKQLQGHIWKEGYDNGEIKGEIYDDVITALKHWTSNNIKIYIYSSGSVDAQKLLFGNSKFGDLLQYINGHFDTTVGAKTESKSYKTISEAIATKPSRILFVTDVTKEARAASEAGFTTAISVRPGNAVLTEKEKSSLRTISTFDELLFDIEESSSKKKAKTDS